MAIRLKQPGACATNLYRLPRYSNLRCTAQGPSLSLHTLPVHGLHCTELPSRCWSHRLHTPVWSQETWFAVAVLGRCVWRALVQLCAATNPRERASDKGRCACTVISNHIPVYHSRYPQTTGVSHLKTPPETPGVVEHPVGVDRNCLNPLLRRYWTCHLLLAVR